MLGALITQLASTVSCVIRAADEPYKVVKELIRGGVASRVSTPIASWVSIDQEIILVLFVLLGPGLYE